MSISQKSRIQFHPVQDPNTVEVRDAIFVCLEKGLAGGSGKDENHACTLAGAISKAANLSTTVKGSYGTKIYVLPTSAVQDLGTGVVVNKSFTSIEGVSVTSRHGYGINSNPSMSSNDANGRIITISATAVELVGLSFNAKNTGINMIYSGDAMKPAILENRFYVYSSGAETAAPYTGGDAINIAGRLADIRNNAFYRCEDSIVSSELRNSLINSNTILGPGYTGLTVTNGINVTGSNVEISENVVFAGNISGVLGTTGITCSDGSCAIIGNYIGGWTTATAGTALTGGNTTVS